MINLNEARLIGRLASDPSFGSTGRGQEYMRVRVITSRSYRDQNDDWQEISVGHNVVTYDKYRIAHGRAELKKGTLVYVEGENNESRREVDGVMQYNRGILVPMGGKLHSLERSEAGSRGEQSAPAAGNPQQSRGKAKGKIPDGPPIGGQNPLDHHQEFEDEIPF